MAEALLRRAGEARFEVVSAGVSPRGVHPLTIRVLAAAGIDISASRSKPVGEFLGQGFDYVITVCDRARATCPVFPGGSETLHWSISDPAEATGSEAQRLAVFERVMEEIAERVGGFAKIASVKAPVLAPVRASGGRSGGS